MWALLQSIKNVIQNKIEGDIVECGVWKGGNLILSQKYLNFRNNKKEIYGFDTFGGMTEPEEVDVDYRSIPASDMHLLHKKKHDKENGWAFCSLADVNKNLNDTVPNNNINLIEGKVEETNVQLIIRDHDMDKFQERKALLEKITAHLNTKHGAGTVELEIKDQYFNMKEKVVPVMHIVDIAEEAMKNLGITPLIKPIRGGTDGSQLSYMGLPCPNIFAGGHNFHGRYEYVPVESIKKAIDVIVEIAQLTAKR